MPDVPVGNVTCVYIKQAMITDLAATQDIMDFFYGCKKPAGGMLDDSVLSWTKGVAMSSHFDYAKHPELSWLHETVHSTRIKQLYETRAAAITSFTGNTYRVHYM